jgi:NAD(P)-dependent dehydrogenase (short-subunit alcohol dehydrogenase family)
MTDTFRDGILDGKHAFVTGGTSGIGLAIARRFARAGARVTLLGRNADKAEAAAATIASGGGEALAVTADVRDYPTLCAALQRSVDHFGPLDVVVNGAAGNFPAPALGMSANGFKAVVDIDLLGTFNASRAAFAHLRRPGAAIVNISATHAFVPTAMQAHVCAAKAGVDMMTRVLAVEWGAEGVRVNSVAPGPIDATEGMRRLAPTESLRREVVDRVPLGRLGTPEEVAELALFLVSPAAAFLTGAVFVCDGGQSLVGFGRFNVAPPGAG